MAKHFDVKNMNRTTMLDMHILPSYASETPVYYAVCNSMRLTDDSLCDIGQIKIKLFIDVSVSTPAERERERERERGGRGREKK
jgi:hypothetical protein